ncbi:MAG: UDP-N-acetylglucosamine 1-carboxyvinyltransferase [Clostridia bacterium]|nr:UDP-N-acetylglucosamine 1-carboxyvinyltransferase [Clostridia bacterium]
MKSYIIEGGKRLEGTVKVSGSKNASLPILAATILNGNSNRLYNVPDIRDTKITLEILKLLGCKIKRNSGKIEINSKNITKTEIVDHLMRKMRSTVILAGALLGRFKEVTFSYPGGCDIGSRPIDLHLNAFKKLGVEITEEAGFIKCKANKIIGTNIDLDFPSVGATENIILATVLSEGTTVINNAAMEPEIVDLANYLKKMGAKIEGAGTISITIKGVKKLSGASYNIMPDRIEAGTLLCAVAGSGGSVTLNDVNPNHLSAVINKLEECGCEIEITNKTIFLKAPKRLKPLEIKTMPYPGFPTDLQQIFSAMLTKANGTSIIIENIFENRYKHLAELRKMGAKITTEGKTAIISGVRKLNSATTVCTDLRGGAALVIAGIMAKGKTKIEDIDYILRGYENIDAKLNSLGAKVKIIEEK